MNLATYKESNSNSFSNFDILTELGLLASSLIVAIICRLAFDSRFSTIVFSSCLFSILLFEGDEQLLTRIAGINNNHFII